MVPWITIKVHHFSMRGAFSGSFTSARDVLKEPIKIDPFGNGGEYQIRTDDLLLAKQAL